ncbi:hypothetical protein E4K66_19430 [Bradyrhizobium frederickii]|uniref:Uncharacterized protein n=1 Tax=Bradyrhizobium frederickii TaxID=2560054 RepID=A0A4Y9L2Q3_9BRAD|nr:hypothetical protein E4K66_19430 [Bradyrhizobium frederickii]
MFYRRLSDPPHRPDPDRAAAPAAVAAGGSELRKGRPGELVRGCLFRHGRACPGHPRLSYPPQRTWMPGTSPGMTEVFDDDTAPR